MRLPSVARDLENRSRSQAQTRNGATRTGVWKTITAFRNGPERTVLTSA
ncbi:MAG TPA: hypothetical protein VFV49_09225 [Thermoanaerobaculia bacterium]|nr:hypothetical protein [Thermoanaerobaculia bacterium]